VKKEDFMNQTKKPRPQQMGSSRREFLRQAAKGGSVAALIAAGVLDPALKKLLSAQTVRTKLSMEALTGPLRSRSLETIRNLLKGEYFRGGRFYGRDIASITKQLPGLCDPVVGGDCRGGFFGDSGCEGGGYCSGQWNCPHQTGCESNCPGDDCRRHYCEDEICVGGKECDGNVCDGPSGQVCGGVADSCENWYPTPEVDSRRMSPFDLADITKYSETQFVKELMEVMNLKSTEGLKAEVKNMIIQRQTLKMKGYM
jgi:hypothetical protein